MVYIKFDTSEVKRLAVDLSEAPSRLQRKAPKVMARGAFQIKKGMRKDASGHNFLSKLSYKVNYDQLDSGGLNYEIGFDKVGQGNLANIIVFGSINNAPVFDHTAALRRETPLILHHLGDAGEDSVFGGAK